jgi:hypothetical protein
MHSIRLYLINKSDLRENKIDSIIDNSKYSKLEWVELSSGIMAIENIPNIKDFGLGKTIALITTDYFGGSGNQTAKVFLDNKKILDQDDEIDWKLNPINSALKLLGVDKKDTMDEFDTVGLGKIRTNNDLRK